MACVKSPKLDDRNEEVNWEYLLVFLYSLFKLRIDSFSCPSFIWPNNLRFKRYIHKYFRPHVLILIMRSQLLKLMELIEI